jgi:hypothetical protein
MSGMIGNVKNVEENVEVELIDFAKQSLKLSVY